MILIYILLFIVSLFLLAVSSQLLINSLTRIAKFLGWKEFVVAFFTIAIGASLPNLFIGILSAIHKIPQLSLGDVIGANIFDLTVVVALAAFISRQGISAPSRTVQGSSIFTIGAALLPLLLLLDNELSRIDGLLLISVFFIYVYWLFKKEDRFKKAYDGLPEIKGWKYFLKELGIFLLSVIMLISGAAGVVNSSRYFAQDLNLPIIFIGIFLVGISDCLPETIFSIQTARHGQDWMILGNIMGSVMITATLVLGMVALIYPIKFVNLPALVIGRFFIAVAAVFFLLFLRSGKKITRKEAVFLFFIYILFAITQFFFR